MKARGVNLGDCVLILRWHAQRWRGALPVFRIPVERPRPLSPARSECSNGERG